MASVGDKLREAREAKGLSLSEAAAMTRIPRTTLRLIESGRFDEFRNDVFIKGHIRSYARELGIPTEPIISAYEKAVGLRAPSAESIELLRSSVVVSNAKPSTPADKLKATWKKHVTPTHMLAAALVLTGVVIFASLLSGSRATAEDPAQFPEADQQDWEIEQDVQETRWLLERPVEDNGSK